MHFNIKQSIGYSNDPRPLNFILPLSRRGIAQTILAMPSPLHWFLPQDEKSAIKQEKSNACINFPECEQTRPRSKPPACLHCKYVRSTAGSWGIISFFCCH